MIKRKLLLLLLASWFGPVAVAAVEAGAAAVPATASDTASGFRVLSRLERLGRRIFFDTNLSDPPGQSCASCHDPNFAFTDPDKWLPTSEGARSGLFGKRNTPTVMYAAATTTPELHYDIDRDLWMGGQFWDGRAKTLEEQAKQPFLNPAEMANPSVAAVVDKVKRSGYAALVRREFGHDAFADPALAFDKMAKAVAAFERTAAFGQYTSKFDAVVAGRATFTAQEAAGETLFLQAGCASCHPLRPMAGAGNPPRPGTDFSYHNIGLPKNPRNRFYSMSAAFNPERKGFVDTGLGGTFPVGSDDRTAQLGRHKTPTLRNIALTAPYGHNGYFNTLKGIVDFYNTRDSKPGCKDKNGAAINLGEELALKRGCWPAPEVSSNVDREIRGGAQMGAMGLRPEDVDAIVAFLKTLTDGWRPLLRF